MSELTKELASERADKETLQEQAKSLHQEYDTLSTEFAKLQKKIVISSPKKDE